MPLWQMQQPPEREQQREEAEEETEEAEEAAAGGGGSGRNPRLIELDTSRLHQWVWTSVASGMIRGYFDVDDRLIIGLSEEQRLRIEKESHACLENA